jgi:hypothetical protein
MKRSVHLETVPASMHIMLAAKCKFSEHRGFAAALILQRPIRSTEQMSHRVEFADHIKSTSCPATLFSVAGRHSAKVVDVFLVARSKSYVRLPR